MQFVRYTTHSHSNLRRDFMKTKWNITALPLLVLGCGGLSSALMALMLKFCLDEKGLLRAFNLPLVLILLLTLAVTVLVILAVRTQGGSNRYGDNFAPSVAGGVTSFAAAGAILLLMLQKLGSQQDILSSIWLVLGFLSVPCLVLTGVSRLKGLRPNFLFHGILCGFFGIHMANQYRFWSSDPEMIRYAFQLFACAGLTLTAYYHTAFDVGMGRRRRQLAIGLLTAYCCLVSLHAEGLSLYYLACALWSAANLCNPEAKPRRPRPDEAPTQDGDPHETA